MFSTLLKTNFKFSVNFILSPANTFNLDQAKILLFGKELKAFAADKYIVVQLMGLLFQ